jgi:hypothetical protein
VNSKGERKKKEVWKTRMRVREGKKIKKRSLWVPIKALLNKGDSCLPKVCSITSEMTDHYFKLVALICIYVCVCMCTYLKI